MPIPPAEKMRVTIPNAVVADYTEWPGAPGVHEIKRWEYWWKPPYVFGWQWHEVDEYGYVYKVQMTLRIFRPETPLAGQQDWNVVVGRQRDCRWFIRSAEDLTGGGSAPNIWPPFEPTPGPATWQPIYE